MAPVELYTTPYCPYCIAARDLLTPPRGALRGCVRPVVDGRRRPHRPRRR
ncbi:MAG: hypothetical protein HGA44_22085 [Cellulomonadaceae bacterium]|nr:hypothetical protein [Cellulomonadaceae bacterium]